MEIFCSLLRNELKLSADFSFLLYVPFPCFLSVMPHVLPLENCAQMLGHAERFRGMELRPLFPSISDYASCFT
jgi:hypothetical protein